MTVRRAWLIIGALSLVVFAGCGDDDGDDTAEQPSATDAPADDESGDQTDDPSDEDADSDVAEEPSDSGGSGAAQATLTIGDETWTFDQLTCGFGEAETGVEGAEVNLSARSGSLSLYLAVEPDSTYLEMSDLDDMDAMSWMSVDDLDVTISGRSVAVTTMLVDDAAGGEPQQGTFQADCD